jgi:type IV pilus assembly protein PilV
MLTPHPNLMPLRFKSMRGGVRQRGMFLIEAVVAILLFMLGILGMVGLSAQAVSTQSDAEYRTLAAQWASQIGQEAWISVSRSGVDPVTRAANLALSLATFEYMKEGDDCDFSGVPSSNATVTAWVAAVRDATHGGLPGSTEFMQQIRIDSTPGGYNKMTVTVCWTVPSQPTVKRRHVFATLIN